MNARENVIAKLAYVVGKARAESLMRTALREHTHELAERVRVEAVNATANDQKRERRALLDLADWIDPEVNTNG